MKEKEAVVAFAFGSPRSIQSNNQIAQVACKKARELNIPIFTQLDVVILDSDIKVSYVTETIKNPPTTYKIALEAIQWAKQNQISKLWIVAAPPHIFRCSRDLHYVAEMLEKVQIRFEVCEEINDFKNGWFCKRSSQKHTTTWWRWWIRELLLLLIPIFIYKNLEYSPLLIA